MFTLRAWVVCALALTAPGCAPYGYNDYYSGYYDDYYDDYYGGYPYAGNTYLNYHGGYPYYYRPWYDYPPWYWYDRDHDDDDDDDDYHRPPHHDDTRERIENQLRNRTDPADLRAEDIAPYRDEIARLPINQARSNATTRRSPGVQRRRPSAPAAASGGFNSGVPDGVRGSIRANRERIRRLPVNQARGDQWQR